MVRRCFSVLPPWSAFPEKMSFSGDQTVKKTDVFIGKASGTGVLNFGKAEFTALTENFGRKIRFLEPRMDKC